MQNKLQAYLDSVQARIDAAKKEYAMTGSDKFTDVEVLLKAFDKMYSALNNIGHIGVVMDYESGQTYDIDPIQEAQECMNGLEALIPNTKEGEL